MDGKGMVVCMSGRRGVDLDNRIGALRPDWHSDDDAQGVVKVVMTESAADPKACQPHIGSKAQHELLAKRMKDPNDPLKRVIVRAMGLTGFDAPFLQMLFVDKPMRGHGFMSAVARVNRVFRDKPTALVVDYIGIAQSLKAALAHPSAAEQRPVGLDEAEAGAALLARLDVVRAMFQGFDYSRGLPGTPRERLAPLTAAID